MLATNSRLDKETDDDNNSKNSTINLLDVYICLAKGFPNCSFYLHKENILLLQRKYSVFTGDFSSHIHIILAFWT